MKKRNMMKKGVVCFLTLIMLAGVWGCGSKEEPSGEPGDTGITQETPEESPAKDDKTAAIAEETLATSEDAEKISAEVTRLAEEGTFEGLKVGFIPQSLSNEFYVIMYEGMLARAEELGVEINAQSPDTQQDVDEQLVCAENLISANCDALIMAPIGSRGLIPAVQLCEDNGIVTVAVDQRFDNDYLVENGLSPIPYVGTDNYSAGQMLGAWTKEHYPQGTKIALLRGVDGAQPNADRYDGFFSDEGVGADYLDVVFEQNCDWETDLGYQAMQNCITANPDVELVFAFCDTIGIGAYRAIQDAGLTDQIDVMGLDGISEGIKMAYQGSFVVDVAQYPYNMGVYALDYAMYLYAGNEVPMRTDAGVAVLDTADKAMEYAESVDFDVTGW